MSYYEVVFLQYFVDHPLKDGFPPFQNSWHELLLFMPLESLRKKSWQKQIDMIGLQLRCVHYDIGVININDRVLVELQSGSLRLRAEALQYVIYEPHTGRRWGYDHQARRWIGKTAEEPEDYFQ